MVSAKLAVLLLASCLLLYRAAAMPEGPPTQFACAGLVPIHTGTQPQTGELPFVVDGISATYTPLNTIEFTITAHEGSFFRGFMIQARVTPTGDPIGVFTTQDDAKQQTLMCVSEMDTLAHMNRNDTTSVTVQWSTENIERSITNFNFYYTIVHNFSTYWVSVQSSAVQVEHPIAPGDINYQLVKAHGSIMILAWALLAPVGIILALFYKVVWPNGEWFYSHIAIMIATIVLTLVGIIVIVVHAQGLWLNTTDANLPHQILGIIMIVAATVNPFLAICRCDPSSEYRFLFNWTHGLNGLILGQGLAIATMLLGLNAFKDLPGVYTDRIHYAIYVMSCIVGILIMILASYNLYAIMFRKYITSEPDELATTSEAPGVIPDKPLYRYENDDDEVDPSRDYLLRAGLGLGAIAIFVALVIANIVLIALA